MRDETTLIYLINKRIQEGENDMADRGLKPNTFKWVLGHVRRCKLIEKEFGVEVDYNWRRIYYEEGLKGAFRTILADFIMRIT